ncbi:MAG: TrkA C-terminal domain-containing protein, partial [Clostridia bacterium]|nr:TrkA C-terminal domain-containing protein [Clostridia bacterium]
ELVISKGSAFENKMVKEIALPTSCILVSVLRNGKMIIPRGNVMLKRDDAIVAACPPENKSEVLAAFRAADAVPEEAEA